MTGTVESFREFYYIQMEKYARQAVSEGVKNSEDLHVSADSEIYRVLNLHYNRNNHIEVWGPQVRASTNHELWHDRFFLLFSLLQTNGSTLLNENLVRYNNSFLSVTTQITKKCTLHITLNAVRS